MALARVGKFSRTLLELRRTTAAGTGLVTFRSLEETSVFPGPAPSRGYPCCAGLDKPPLPKIMIRYPKGEVDAFISIADAIEDEHDEVKVDGEEVHAANFEVVLEDGQTLWSSSNGQAPSTMEILSTLQNLQTSSA